MPPFWFYYRNFFIFLYVESEYSIGLILSTMWCNILKTLSSNFSSSRHDKRKLNTDSESALKNPLKNDLKCILNFFWVRKNGSWAFLRMFFYAIFNSKHISSSKHFSKMLLKAIKALWIDRAAILIHSLFSHVFQPDSVIFYVPTRRIVSARNWNFSDMYLWIKWPL